MPPFRWTAIHEGQSVWPTLTLCRELRPPCFVIAPRARVSCVSVWQQATHNWHHSNSSLMAVAAVSQWYIFVITVHSIKTFVVLRCFNLARVEPFQVIRELNASRTLCLTVVLINCYLFIKLFHFCWSVYVYFWACPLGASLRVLIPFIDIKWTNINNY